MNWKSLLLGGVCAMGLGVGAAFAQDSTTKYQQWGADEGSADVEALIGDLEELIDQAERDRAADPQFLEDLRDVLADYQSPWTVRVLFDDFSDGEFARNPAWTVSSGNFKVDRKGGMTGLRSTIIPPGQTIGQTSSTGNPAIDIFNILLNQQGTTQTQPTAQYAAIYTPAKISNAFAMRLELASGERFGRFDVGPYQGPSGSAAYRLAYLPGAAKDSLRLVRITSKGAVALATYKKPLVLEDGRRHVLEWTRDRNGAMAVLLDGQEIIKASDRTLTKPFDGLMMINSGGTYWVRSITVDGAK